MAAAFLAGAFLTAARFAGAFLAAAFFAGAFLAGAAFAAGVAPSAEVSSAAVVTVVAFRTVLDAAAVSFFAVLAALLAAVVFSGADVRAVVLGAATDNLSNSQRGGVAAPGAATGFGKRTAVERREMGLGGWETIDRSSQRVPL